MLRKSPSPDIIFHVGLHKTGTTWLQSRIFTPAHGRHLSYTENRGDLRGVFLKPRHDAFLPETAHATLDPLIAEARSRGWPAVVSDEALGGLPFGDRFRQAVTFQRIQATYSQAALVITIREQRRVLQSVYGHYLRGGGTASLASFLSQPPPDRAATWDPIVDLDYYDYNRLLSYAETLFGEGRVLMVPMEWMLADPTALLTRMGEMFSINWTGFDPPSTEQVVNSAWSTFGYGLNRRLNYLKAGKPRWDMKSWWLKPNAVAAWADRLTPAGLRRRQKARQLETINRAIGEHYAASNTALADRLGLDLAAFGYRTA